MPECHTINCPKCDFQLDESFVEQKCPRCQTIIESKFICGSCHSCLDITGYKKEEKLNKSSIKKLFLSFISKLNF